MKTTHVFSEKELREFFASVLPSISIYSFEKDTGLDLVDACIENVVENKALSNLMDNTEVKVYKGE